MRKFILAYLSILLFTTTWVCAQKTDTIRLYNGDRITCEIRSLSKGKLSVKTSDMSNLSIKWTRVASIESLNQFEITLTDHSSYLGKFNRDSVGIATISFGIFEEYIPLLEITKLTKINSSFIKRINGFIDVGYSYTKGTENSQLNSSGEVKHRSKKFLNRFTFDIIASDNSVTVSRKQNGAYTFQAYHKKGIFSVYTASWQRNTELGIENRTSANARFGYSLIDNSVNLLDVSGGVLVNKEVSSEQISTNNIEGMIDIVYDLFVFTKPNIDLSTNIVMYPSFTVKNRFRSDFDFRVRWEVFSSFTFNFKYYFAFDTKPPSVDALNFDFGISTSIGYTF